MAEDDRPDRFASGTGVANAGKADNEMLPGVTGGDRAYLPQSGGADVEGSNASSAEGTVGAVGEMDLTGAPAGTSGAGGISGGSSAGESQGGGPGGGAMSGGGVGPAAGDAGPQSIESTIAFLGDRELSGGNDAGGTGGSGGAGGTGGAGGSDVAGDDALTGSATEE
jgi:hypothetical protein